MALLVQTLPGRLPCPSRVASPNERGSPVLPAPRRSCRIPSLAADVLSSERGAIMTPMLKRGSLSTGWIGVLLVGLVGLQQGPFIIRGDYSRQLVWKSTSPDERYRVEVRRQVAFPAILDPSGWAYFSVVDTRTGKPSASILVPLRQFFDFQKPRVEWRPTAVEVLDFDQGRPADG